MNAKEQNTEIPVSKTTNSENKFYLPWDKTEKMEFDDFVTECIDSIPEAKIPVFGFAKSDVIQHFRIIAERYTDFLRKHTGFKNDFPKLAVFSADIRNITAKKLDAKKIQELESKLLRRIESEVKKIKDSKKFVSLGVTNSGKTTFMASMYYKMAMPIEGFQLMLEDNDQHQKMKNIYARMVDTSLDAPERFPLPTNQSDSYLFSLQFKHDLAERFEWLDYRGGILQDGRGEELDKLKQHISSAEVLYVFVDGSLFKDREGKNETELIDEILYDVANECALDLNHFLSGYGNTNLRIPPVAIIVTKYDLIYKEFYENRNLDHEYIITKIINEVIKKAFSGLFTEQDKENIGYRSMIGIIPVSLGAGISENDYHGKFQPDNVQFAALMGVWFLLNKETENSDSSDPSTMKKKRDAMRIIEKAIDDVKYIHFYTDGKEEKFSECANRFKKDA